MEARQVIPRRRPGAVPKHAVDPYAKRPPCGTQRGDTRVADFMAVPQPDPEPRRGWNGVGVLGGSTDVAPQHEKNGGNSSVPWFAKHALNGMRSDMNLRLLIQGGRRFASKALDCALIACPMLRTSSMSSRLSRRGTGWLRPVWAEVA